MAAKKKAGKASNSASNLLGVNLVNKNGGAAGANALGAGAGSIAHIRCHICGVTKSTTEYSNRQLQKHQNSIHNPYIPGGRSTKDYATCKDCTAGQVMSLKCIICEIVKPLESFGKVQRNHPQKARCRACVQLCLDTERGQEACDSDEYVEEDGDDSDVDNVDAVSNSRPPKYSKPDGSDDESDDEEAPGAPIAPARFNRNSHNLVDDEDVDAPGTPDLIKSKVAAVTKEMATLNTSSASSSSGRSSPGRSSLGSSSSGRSSPVVRGLATSSEIGWVAVSAARRNKFKVSAKGRLDNDVSSSSVDDGDGGKENSDSDVDKPTHNPASIARTPNNGPASGPWTHVPVAVKTGSAFTWASRAASAINTNAPTTRNVSGKASAIASTGINTPMVGTAATGLSSARGKKWAKPEKPKQQEEPVWQSAKAVKNGWGTHGGQPAMVKRRKKNMIAEEDGESSDAEEY